MIQLIESSHITDSSLSGRAQQAFQKLLARADVGFFRCMQSDLLYERVKSRAQQISASRPIVIIGIGGSSLGAKAIHQAMEMNPMQSRELYFLENPDPVSWHRIQARLGDWSKAHYLAISKSGRTLETLVLLESVLGAGVKPDPEHFTLITEETRNPLSDWGRTLGLPNLPVPIDVGGRFSIFSPVGLLPMALMGCDVGGFRRGQMWALQQSGLVTELASQCLMSWKREEWITGFWAYSDRLRETGYWIQQLWSESLAKKVSAEGAAPRVSTPLPMLGATDQHSLLQQVVEGSRDKWIWVIEVKRPRVDRILSETCQVPHGLPFRGVSLGNILAIESEANYQALKQAGVSALRLQIDRLDEAHMGAWFMTMALLVGTLGEMLGINAYNQPGVESGKRLAHAMLAKQVVSSR